MSLRHAILAAVSLKPQTGYDLSRRIDGSIGYFWNATHQQIYKELGALEGEGLLQCREVSQAEKPNKKIYRLTKPGLRELRSWVAEEAELPPAKDALLIKLFAAHLVDPSVIAEVIEKHAVKRRARLERYRAIEREHFRGKTLSRAMQFQRLTVRRGILFEEAWLLWANEALAFVRHSFMKSK